jgi:hypothetical protein
VTGAHVFGTMLFDLRTDPGQRNPLLDDDLEMRMAGALVRLMRDSDAPESQFERLGLPADGPVGPEHLLARAHHRQAVRAAEPAPDPAGFPAGKYGVHDPLRTLLQDPAAAAIIRQHAPGLTTDTFATIAADISLYRAAAFAIGMLPWDTLRAIAAELAAL